MQIQPLTLQEALDYQTPPGFEAPVFLRHEVAKILSCTVLTLRNREKAGKYPPAKRNPNNNYRIYSFNDICRLQMITYGQIFLSPIIAVLYDKGYTDITTLDSYLNAQLVIFKSELMQENAGQTADVF